jgi:hypothetical protein
VSSLFQERPIWSRLALVTRLRQIGGADIGVSALKRFLPAVAFYFLNGPWRSVGAALTTTASDQPRTPRYS